MIGNSERKNSISRYLQQRKAYKCIYVIVVTFVFANCNTEEIFIIQHKTSTVSDIDGNVYTTVLINGKWWMQENLRVTRFNDGKPVKYSTSGEEWMKPLAAYCSYDNQVTTTGYLYNYFTISDSSNIAPIGWHVPSDDEWIELEKYLGLLEVDLYKVNWRGSTEGDKLKAQAPDGWIYHDNVWGNNQSGFNAYAGSCRLFNGVFGSPGFTANAFFWTSSPEHSGGWYRHLDYKCSNIFRYYAPANYGFSIRCVKN